MKTVKCPFCSGTAELKIVSNKRIFRREEFDVFEYFYRCGSCKEEFTNTTLDEINVNQVYNKYREKNSIPFPEQLKDIRKHYNLSAARMSELLGFGTNQYRLYEDGEIPSGGNATVLSLLLNPAAFKNIIVLPKKDLLGNKYDEVIKRLDENIDQDPSKVIERMIFPSNIIPNRFTGYTIPDFDKSANMALFFIKEAPFKVRLNKLLYYSDFAHYKYAGFSISGCKYAAIDMGTVPDQYSLLFGLLETKEYLTTELVNIRGKEHDKYIPAKEFDSNLFSKSELDIMNTVLKSFKNKTTEMIKNISHKEIGWLDNIDKKALVDYSLYAPLLKAF